MKILEIITNIGTAEWLLTWCKWPNGGSVIFLRALITSIFIYSLILIFIILVDPDYSSVFSAYALRIKIIETLPWMGALYVAIYTALYARFASQWAYLANLFNQIKASEIKKVDNPSELTAWKAGFIEDCEDLHLATKPMFATLIHVWLTDEKYGKDVIDAFIKYAPGGKTRYLNLLKRVETVHSRIKEKYKITDD